MYCKFWDSTLCDFSLLLNSEPYPLASQTNKTLAFDEIIFHRQIYE